MSYTNNTGTSDTATYTANANVSGTDQFTYRVSDGKGGTDTATVTITFQNAAPVAGDDTVTASVGRSTVINIGANDSDANNDELFTSGVTNPTQGRVSYTNNNGVPDTATYTPFATAEALINYLQVLTVRGTDTAT